MDDYFKFFIKNFQQETKCRQLNGVEVSAYEKKLPSKLLSYWKERGLCSYGRGMLWTTYPSDYSGVMSELLRNTKFEKNDKYHVIARTAFGELYLWGEKTGHSLRISPIYGSVYALKEYTDEIQNGKSDLLIGAFFSTKKKAAIDYDDFNDEPLFERALNIYGELEHDEMYGFEPALVIGGVPKLENLRKVKILDHLSILAELEPMQVVENLRTA